MSNGEKLRAIRNLMLSTKQEIDEARSKDWEYNTSQGNGVNASEVGQFFDAFSEDMKKILDTDS